MTEAKLQASIIKWLSAMPNTEVIKIIRANKRGVPDLFYMGDGRGIWFEVKVGANRASQIQRAEMERINNAGFETYVVRSLDEVKKLIGKWSNA